jgi:hypothetical protein
MEEDAHGEVPYQRPPDGPVLLFQPVKATRTVIRPRGPRGLDCSLGRRQGTARYCVIPESSHVD